MFHTTALIDVFNFHSYIVFQRNFRLNGWTLHYNLKWEIGCIHFKVKKKNVGSIECMFLFRNILTHTFTHTQNESDILLIIKFTSTIFLHAFPHFLKFQKLFYFYNKYANKTKIRCNLKIKSGWEISCESLGMDMSKASLS